MDNTVTYTLSDGQHSVDYTPLPARGTNLREYVEVRFYKSATTHKGSSYTYSRGKAQAHWDNQVANGNYIRIA